ncbi:glycoside hydrolase family 18 protein [Desarmillaria tabescens]|uniref:Glycoside hydrolase family 18 protein n=1 Tax=Armillaria tabescens TaxID=1929756 RepID=A0AA39U0U4_ARMTA|nr:glycoside hydrolase family 18 protein [Desarmillaria tabescens]KAK0464775.1 glycoside hydrolase family 18 protein [Desarmillaria tabescens]
MGFKHTLFLCIACFAVVTVNATAVMRRPDKYKDSPSTTGNQTTPEARDLEERNKGKASVAYFTNWGIYGADFQPQDIVTDTLSHILYSFADVDPWSGVIRLTDSWADEEKHYDGDSWTESGTNLYGCLKQLYLIKLANRKIKVLLSIGGWTYSQAGHFAFVTSESSRATFVSNAVTLIEDYGLSDLDFEYPSNADEGQGFADLITELRTAFDNLTNSKGDSTPYQLSAAVAAGSNNYANLVVPQMNAALTYWNLMSYDYSGEWLDYSDNQANLYGGERTGVNTDAAVQHYISAGADAWKINMGIPLYGRAFENTDGLGASYSGVGSGTIEAGVYSYNVLPIGNAQVFENTGDISSYSYDWSCRELVSYDTPNIVALKAKYINDCGLAGSMFWELSTDKVGSDSLVGAAAGVLGTLDKTKNHISYPNSKWDNIRSNMGQW